MEVAAEHARRARRPRRPREHDGLGLGRECAHHDGPTRLHDPRLLGGDRGERVAELVGVLEFDRRHAGDGRIDDVGRVEASPETHLEHDAVELRLGEEQERGGGGDIEEGRRARGILVAQRDDVRAQSLERRGERGVVDLAAVDAKALRPAREVRRGEGADAFAGRSQHRFGEQDGRALPLRTGDVHDREPRLRIADTREQAADRREIEALVAARRPAARG